MAERKIASTQETADDLEQLRSSYDHLYSEGWLGKHRHVGQTELLINLANTSDGNFLDVASGVSFSLDIAERKGANAFGVELSSAALHIAKEENPRRKVIQGNGEKLPFNENSFDSLICIGSLEHFIHPDLGVREISRVLKPTGTAAILLPNSHNLLAIYSVYKYGGILTEQQDYERFATRVEWEAFLKRNGLVVVSTHKFNVGFARIYKKDGGLFWYIFNALYRLFEDRWIPLNFSFNLVFVCKKAP